MPGSAQLYSMKLEIEARSLRSWSTVFCFGHGEMTTNGILGITPANAWSYQPSESSYAITTAVLDQSGERISELISRTTNCCSSAGFE
jgi:hypothetical protein